jgi:hypothetical protein
VYRAQFGDVSLYRWLIAVGLHQRKSLTLGALQIPDEMFLPAVRGLLDGDGSVYNFVHRPTRREYPDYWYERLLVKFRSASRPHIDWLHAELRRQLSIEGCVEIRPARRGRHEMFHLNYGKHESVTLLTKLYEDPHAPRLVRKWRVWDSYRRRNLVPKEGLEPSRPCGHMALNHTRIANSATSAGK